MQLQEMMKQRAALLKQADSVVSRADGEQRKMTGDENLLFDGLMAAANNLGTEIGERQRKSTIRLLQDDQGQLLPASGRGAARFTVPLGSNAKELPRQFYAAEYLDAFHEFVSSGGNKISAALYEGNNTAGGYAVPVLTDGAVVPLAPQEMAVRRLARVVPTMNDLKVPVKATFGVAATKAESGSSANTFTDSDPTLGEFTLSAFMVGRQTSASWELLQDVSQFQAFVVDDLVLSVQMFEESKFVGGSGTGEAQGLIGNTGAGVTAASDAGSDLLDSTYDVQGTLNAVYQSNASWLMNRSTGVLLRKAQKQANLFEPVFTRSNGQDYLHGFPVEYSASMPTAAASSTPVLFGDFNAGYIVGDRGGAGISIKFLDQIKAVDGQLVLLAYRRTDGRVRRSEAIQAITIAAS